MMDLFVKDLEELFSEDQKEDDDDDAFEYNSSLETKINDSIQRIEQDTASSLDHDLIADCNSFSVDIDNEIDRIHNFIRDLYRPKFPDFIRDLYRPKFPELETLVPQPIDYARVVKTVGNETDLSHVDLRGLVPSPVIMAVSLTASSTSVKPLPEQVVQKTIDGRDRILRLDATKTKILDFIERQMLYIAPNLSGIVGSGVAAKLIGAAGGLSTLATMPACNVQHLGAKRKAPLAGFSSSSINRVGYLEETEIFQTVPPSLRMRACRVLAAKAALASRVDCMKADPTDNTGMHMRYEILKKIDKWKEPPPARLPKPLPVPDSQPRKKRGGVRQRKTKDRYGMTEMRKSANRMAFGVAEDSSLGAGYGQGYGMMRGKTASTCSWNEQARCKSSHQV